MKENTKKHIEAWMGVFVAVCALVLSVWEGYQTREHDRLSVKPDCSLEAKGELNSLTFSIQNSGLGPCKIAGLRIFVDGSGAKDINDLLTKIGDTKVERMFGRNIRGMSVMPGKQEAIFALHWDNDLKDRYNPERVAMGNLLVGRLHTNLCYCSMYSECWTLKTYSRSTSNRISKGCLLEEGPEFSAFTSQ